MDLRLLENQLPGTRKFAFFSVTNRRLQVYHGFSAFSDPHLVIKPRLHVKIGVAA